MQVKKASTRSRRQVTLTDINSLKQRLLTTNKVKRGSSEDLENEIK